MQVAYEIIYVNDDSPDHTGSILKQVALENANVIAVDLMFNSGQFKALLCGLELSRGSYVVTMDDDLQHPPEEIYKLYHKIKENDQLDAVIGRYLKKKHSFFRNLGSLFMQKLSGSQRTGIKMTSFRCLSRNVVEIILMHKTTSPFIGSIIRKSTRRIANVDVEHHARAQGKSNYSLKKLAVTGIDRIFHYTSVPLKLVSISGIVISIGSFAAALYYLLAYFMGHIALPGWTTLVLLINFYAGLIILSIGIIGEYLIRILGEVSGSPRYFIRNIYRRQDHFVNPEGKYDQI